MVPSIWDEFSCPLSSASIFLPFSQISSTSNQNISLWKIISLKAGGEWSIFYFPNLGLKKILKLWGGEYDWMVILRGRKIELRHLCNVTKKKKNCDNFVVKFYIKLYIAATPGERYMQLSVTTRKKIQVLKMTTPSKCYKIFALSITS